jgi:hypothetical protein
LPTPPEGVDKEDVPGERNQAIKHAVGILQVDNAVLDVFTRVKKHLTLSIEFKSLRWLVNLIGSLKILRCSLC